jgi:4'-phosphopantetheinyl transferase
MPDGLTIAPSQFALGGLEIHWLWLGASAPSLARAFATVTAEERAAAARFRRSRDGEAFVLRRAFLRERLAACLDVPTAEVVIRADAHGKPRLEGFNLGFNLSKSGDLAVVALAPGHQVGCDIEWRRPGLAPNTAELVFSEREQADLAATPADRRVEAFFNGWTRKEAVVKAIGLGLSYPLKSFDVSLKPDDDAALLSGPAGWALAACQPLPGLHLAVCVSSLRRSDCAQAGAISYRAPRPARPPQTKQGAYDSCWWTSPSGACGLSRRLAWHG